MSEEKNYQINFPASQLQFVITMLEQTPAPLIQTRPIWENIRVQVDEQNREPD